MPMPTSHDGSVDLTSTRRRTLSEADSALFVDQSTTMTEQCHSAINDDLHQQTMEMIRHQLYSEANFGTDKENEEAYQQQHSQNLQVRNDADEACCHNTSAETMDSPSKKALEALYVNTAILMLPSSLISPACLLFC